MREGTRLPVVLALWGVVVLAPLLGACNPGQYRFEDVTIAATVRPDGSLHVEEQRRVTFHGEHSRLHWTVPRQGSREMREVRVSEDGRAYQPTKDAASLPEGGYAFWGDDTHYHLEWYFRADGTTERAFDLVYAIVGAVQVHQDVAELRWQFIGEGWPAGSRNALVVLRLPPGTKAEEIRAWGHGPPNLQTRVVGPQEVRWQARDLPAGRSLEGRVVFPPGLVPQVKVMSGARAYAAIAAEEDQRLREGERVTRVDQAVMASGFLLAALGVFLAAMYYLRWGQRLAPRTTPEYCYRPPADCTPAEAAWLLSDTPSPAGLTATTLHLAKRGYLRLEPSEEARILGRRREVGDVAMRRLRPADEQLLPHERLMLEYIFQMAGRGQEVISCRALGHSAQRHASLTSRFLGDWQGELERRGRTQGYLDRTTGPRWMIGGIGIVSVGWAGVAHTLGHPQAAIGAGVAALACLGASLLRRRLSQEGEDQLALWRAFANYLKNCARLDRASSAAPTDWEAYLICAEALGAGQSALGQLIGAFPAMTRWLPETVDAWWYGVVAADVGTHHHGAARAEHAWAALLLAMESAWEGVMKAEDL